ncbi:hypothetical protein Vdis_1678 [Vulcanisaeta distributa DSM 14429]|uniref:Uncharacterized protein n=1 Tax=Vulcanisaeta distributa (strain DSM 14429 / JCM 11212 / NBRC 100878 / IC-017) TaxID=572478 RepID=E1QU60_VULDI|nr:hypothetical protein Vdis_1678 [Vulcanisaeta distributa DSM 14429]
MNMGGEEKQKWTGSTVTDCFLTWVEILEQAEKKEKRKDRDGNTTHKQ